jgi:hypothetical protein
MILTFIKGKAEQEYGNFAYKVGISFTKWEPCVTNGNLGLLFTGT